MPFKSIDAFSRSIGFTLDKEEKHRTCLGAFMTFIIYLLCIVFVMVIITQPLEAGVGTTTITASETTGETDTNSTSGGSTSNTTVHNGFEVSMSPSTKILTKKHTMNDDSEIVYPGNDGFMMAFQVQNNNIDPDQLALLFRLLIKNSSGTYIDYVTAEYCTDDHFPSELVDQLTEQGVIGYYLCPNKSQMKLMNQRYGYQNSVIFNTILYLCNGQDTCVEYTEIASKYSGDIVQIVIVQGYYDHDDFENPVKYKADFMFNHILPIAAFSTYTFDLTQHVVNMLDGSTQTFYTAEVKSQIHTSYYYYNQVLYYFSLNDDYVEYNQFTDYQIVGLVDDESRRNLASSDSEKEDIMSTEYLILFTLAQFGGLYTCLHLLFGLFVNRWTHKSMNLALINSLYKQNNKLVNSQDNLGSAQVMPEGSDSNNNRSFQVENTPLIENSPVIDSNGVNQKSMSKSKNKNDNEQFDGGEYQVEPLERSKHKSGMIDSSSMYSLKDLCYQTFCCHKKKTFDDHQTLGLKYTLSDKQINLLLKERGVIKILTTLNLLKDKVKEIDSKLENELSRPQSLPIDHEPKKAPKIGKVTPPEEVKQAIVTKKSTIKMVSKQVNQDKWQSIGQPDPKLVKNKVDSINNILEREIENMADNSKFDINRLEASYYDNINKPGGNG